MSETSHTPGPWRECGAEHGGCICRQVWSVTGDVMVAIAVENDEFHPLPPAIAHANASLIAAAPALLEACRLARDQFLDLVTERSVDLGSVDGVIKFIEAAIAQAKTT